jgi:hypothetical protein
LIYLSPEPMLQSPNWVQGEVGGGFSTPTYSYARNNPVRYTDPTGLCPPGLEDTYDCCIINHPGVPEACGGFTGPKPVELPKFNWWSLVKPANKFITDVCTVVSMANSASKAKERKCNDFCINNTVKDVSGDPFWLCRSCCLGTLTSPECGKFGSFPD